MKYILKIYPQPDEYEIQAKNKTEASRKADIIIVNRYPDFLGIYKTKLERN